MPEIEERNGIYYIDGKVVGEKPLSTEWTPEELVIEGAILGKPLELAGKGLLVGTKIIAPKTTGFITKFFKKINNRAKSVINYEATPSKTNLKITTPTDIQKAYEDVIKYYLSDYYKLKLLKSGYSDDQANKLINTLISNLSDKSLKGVPGLNDIRIEYIPKSTSGEYINGQAITKVHPAKGVTDRKVILNTASMYPRGSARHEFFHSSSLNIPGIETTIYGPNQVFEAINKILPQLGDMMTKNFSIILNLQKGLHNHLEIRALALESDIESKLIAKKLGISAEDVFKLDENVLSELGVNNLIQLKRIFGDNASKATKRIIGGAGVTVGVTNEIQQLKQGGTMNILDYLKEGSGIHIKKKNRGKFTDYCGGKVTSECIARGKNSPSATIRKRATFAANARKWKHEDGGIIKAEMGTNLYIDTRRNTQRSQEGLTLEQYKQLLEETSKLNPQGQDVILLEETESKTPIATSTEQTDWTNEFKIDNEQAGPVQQVNPTVAAATYTSSSTNLNKDRLREALKKRGLDDDTVDALLVQAGAESGYNYQIKNPNSSAYGLGQWIAANHKPVIDHINLTKGKNYTKITDLDFDDQAEALAWWYYDRNKDKLDSQLGLFNKAKMLAKIGLSPAILAGSYTYNKTGKTYRDTDEDWLAWFTDTGHNPSEKIKTFDDHVKARLRHAGYTQV